MANGTNNINAPTALDYNYVYQLGNAIKNLPSKASGLLSSFLSSAQEKRKKRLYRLSYYL